MTNYRTNESSY